MSSVEYISDGPRKTGVLRTALEPDKIDLETLLEKAELHWSVQRSETDYHTVYDDGMRHDIDQTGEDIIVRLAYSFSSVERKSQKQMRDLWDIYVEPIIQMSKV